MANPQRETCDEINCQSTDRNGEIGIGIKVYHVCRHHYRMVTGAENEDGTEQIGLTRRASIRILPNDKLEIFFQ